MKTPARLLGHPIHQMLIVFPLGLLATSFVFDIVHWATEDPQWALVSFWMITSGIIGGALAAVFGVIDWLAIPRGTRAHRIGLAHGLGNVGVMVLFILSWLLRYESVDVPPSAMVLAAAGILLALVTAWLGGELVVRLGVGVHEGAGLDAPSSLHSDSPRDAAASMPPSRGTLIHR